ncbi:MAG: ABC transporter substrate-binding protein [Oligoflexia bacterium]|nr:ABC transporter substrate-binding protein [Oligoflexia bacterium]
MFKKLLVLPALFLSLFVFALHAKEVKVASLDWPPYTGEGLDKMGPVMELVAEAFKRSGHTVTASIVPWNRATTETEAGNFDSYGPEYPSSDVESKYDVSDKFPCGPLVLLKRKGAKINYTGKVSELKQYSLGVVTGYVNTKEIDDPASGLKKEGAETDEMNMKKLISERIDLIVIDPYVAQYLTNKNPAQLKDKWEQVEPILEKKELYLAFSKKVTDRVEKIKAFNDGLKALQAEGYIEKYLKKVSGK